MCLGSESLRSWNTPAPKVFISHLLCLAQTVDSAGLFILFFYVKGYSEPHFFHRPDPSDTICSSWGEKKPRWATGLSKCLLYVGLRRKWLNEMIDQCLSQDCSGRFLILETEWLYFTISKSMINPTFQSCESTNEEKWNDLGPLSDISLSVKNPRPETPLSPLCCFKDT